MTNFSVSSIVGKKYFCIKKLYKQRLIKIAGNPSHKPFIFIYLFSVLAKKTSKPLYLGYFERFTRPAKILLSVETRLGIRLIVEAAPFDVSRRSTVKRLFTQ